MQSFVTRQLYPAAYREDKLWQRNEGNAKRAGRIVLPTPQCIVFYNGMQELPEEQTLRLSDSFERKEVRADVELTVRVLNINYGHNRELMEKCRILEEYSHFVQITRQYMEKAADYKTALSDAIDYCIDHDILSEFLRINRMEVLGMFLEEFDVEKYERTLKEEGREEGVQYIIEILQEAGHDMDFVRRKLTEKYSMPEQEAEQKLLLYWK